MSELRYDDLTSEDRLRLLEECGFRCECCGCELHIGYAPHANGRTDPYLPNVDHDHATGLVRGVICEGCNLQLGRHGDTLETLMSYDDGRAFVRKAVAYLERTR